jgi:hypothetical protein
MAVVLPIAALGAAGLVKLATDKLDPLTVHCSIERNAGIICKDLPLPKGTLKKDYVPSFDCAIPGRAGEVVRVLRRDEQWSLVEKKDAAGETIRGYI